MRRALLWGLLLSTIGGVLIAFVCRLSDRQEPVEALLRLDTSSAARTVPPRSAAAISPPAGPPQQLEPLPAPSFTLTDQAGRPFDSSTLKGKVWIADFIFTSCAGSCPQMSSRMALLQSRLPAQIPLLSISVDPSRDTPPALAAYAKRYGAQPDRWFFLTGPEEATRRIVQQGFRLSIAEGGGPEEPIVHSVRMVLVDRSGRIRGYYDATDPDRFERLIRDAGSL